MWTKQEDVINYANTFLQDVTLQEIEEFSQDLQIELTKEQVSKAILHKIATYGVDIDEQPILENYDMFNSILDIYGKKCWAYCHILRTLALVTNFNLGLIERLDITVEKNKVLTSDLDRILKPLRKNYELASKLKSYAEKIDVYLEMDRKLPKIKVYRGILNMSNKDHDDAMEMTEKQKKDKQAKHDALVKKIYLKHIEEEKKTID